MKKLLENKKNRTIISLSIILILNAFLGLYGIHWGLPSQKKSQLILTNPQKTWDTIKKISSASQKRLVFHDKHKTSMYDPTYLKKAQELLTQKEALSLKNDNMLGYVHAALIQSFHPDEWNYFSMLAQMDPGVLDFNPHMFIYSSFHAYVLGALLKFSQLLGYVNLQPDVSFYLFHPEEIAKFYIVGRAFSVIMGMLCVFLLFHIGKFCYSWWTGVLASLFLAVTPLFTIWMHYGGSDIHSLFWVLLSFYLAIKVLKTGKLKYYIFAGLSAGIAAGTKYPNGAIIIVLIGAHIVRHISGKQRLQSIIFDKSVWIGCLAVLIGFLITNPYSIIAMNEFLSDLKTVSIDASLPRPSFDHLDNKWLYYLSVNFPLSMGLPFYICSLFGIIYVLWKHENTIDWMILLFLLAFSIYLGKIATKMIHYGLPLVPFFALLAARLLIELAKRFRFTIIISVTMIILYTVSYSLAYSQVFAKEDVRLEAGKWIRDNLPENTSIGLPTPLKNYEYPVIDPFFYNLKYIGFNQDILQKQSVDYILISEFRYGDIIRLKEKAAKNILFGKS